MEVWFDFCANVSGSLAEYDIQGKIVILIRQATISKRFDNCFHLVMNLVEDMGLNIVFRNYKETLHEASMDNTNLSIIII